MSNPSLEEENHYRQEERAQGDRRLRHHDEDRQPRQSRHELDKASSSTVQGRIVGGSAAPVGRYPFFVSWGGCGATLIHPDILLTAAHCKPDEDEDEQDENSSASTPSSSSSQPDHVWVGAVRRNNGSYGAEKRSIDTDDEQELIMIQHPNYNSTTFQNDFMVIKLTQPSTKRPIRLAHQGSSDVPVETEALTIMGMGTRRQWSNTPSSFLEHAQVTFVNNRTCNDPVWSYGGAVDDTTMFCAGNIQRGNVDTCQGDSGGPIVKKVRGGGGGVSSSSTDFVQVGVTSFGYGCGRRQFPGVYARVSSARDWIDGMVCELSNDPPHSCPNGAETIVEGTSSENSSSSTTSSSTTTRTIATIRVEIQTDRYPHEIGYSIRREGDDPRRVLEVLPTGTLRKREVRYVHTYTIPTGQSYIFRITDTVGDGICCGYGIGSYRVYLENDEEVDEATPTASSSTIPIRRSSTTVATASSKLLLEGNGQYGKEEERRFNLDEEILSSEQQQQQQAPQASQLMIRITFDVHPEQVGWVLQAQGQVLASARVGSYDDHTYIRKTESIPIPAFDEEDFANNRISSMTLTFVMVDLGADGGSTFVIDYQGENVAHGTVNRGIASVTTFSIEP